MQEVTINKFVNVLMVIYFLVDPDLLYLTWPDDLKIHVVAAALLLVSRPWIADQFNG